MGPDEFKGSEWVQTPDGSKTKGCRQTKNGFLMVRLTDLKIGQHFKNGYLF